MALAPGPSGRGRAVGAASRQLLTKVVEAAPADAEALAAIPGTRRWCWPVSPTRSSRACEDESVKFTLEQRYAADADAVAAAYADPALYAAFGDLPRAGRPEVLRHERSTAAPCDLDVRWKFTGELSSAARAVIDPDRLTWVRASVHDLAARTVTFRMVADHYADRFSCSGLVPVRGARRSTHPPVHRGRPADQGAPRRPAVESAIVTGSRSSSAPRSPIVERFLEG